MEKIDINNTEETFLKKAFLASVSHTFSWAQPQAQALETSHCQRIVIVYLILCGSVNKPDLKCVLTLKDVGTYLVCSEWIVRTMVWQGSVVLTCVRRGDGKKIYIDIRDLDRFIEKNKSQSGFKKH